MGMANTISESVRSKLYRTLHMTCVRTSWSPSAIIGHRHASSSSGNPEIFERYARRLEAKAREKGLENAEQLMSRYRKLSAVNVNPYGDGNKQQQRAVTSSHRENVQAATHQPTTPDGSAQILKPVKTLHDIMDMKKIEAEDSKTIGAIWKAYNASKGNLSAVIPKDVYDRLYKNAKKYPMFILPLSRAGGGEDQDGIEMHLLQWSFFENRQSHVIFTSLGEYKLRTEFAQPHLTLSHYTEFAETKGIVLMKGELDIERKLINSQQAQWLAFSLQQFYVTGGQEKKALLQAFHENPGEFDYRALIEEANRFSAPRATLPTDASSNPGQSTHQSSPLGHRSFSTSSRRHQPPSSTDQQGLRNRAFVGPFTFRAGGIFIITAAGLYFYFQNEKAKIEKKRLEAKQSLSAGRAKIGGPFKLIDQHGQEYSDKDLLGKFSLIYFGFTRCPDICPLEIDKMGQVVDDLDKEFSRETIVPVFITCDPARDKVEDVKQYVDEFHPRLVGLTGTFDEIKAACRQYRVYFSSPPNVKPGDDYLVDHSIFFYLMDPKGQFVDAFGRQFTRQDVTLKISKYIREWESTGTIAPGQNILK